MSKELTDSLRDAGKGRGRVGGARDVSPNVVGLDSVLADAHVLAHIRNLSSLAAWHVVFAV